MDLRVVTIPSTREPSYTCTLPKSSIPDVYQDERIPHEAYRPTFVKSMAMVPVRYTDPIAAIGAYWARHHHATEAAMRILRCSPTRARSC